MPRKPIIYAIAGIPGAGKTSFVKAGRLGGTLPADAFWHDCDAVMQALPGYQADLAALGPPAAFARWEKPAQRSAEAELMGAISRREDIIYDRSCALMSSYVCLQQAVHAYGYSLNIVWLKIPVPMAIQRCVEREARTGRHVPVILIKERAHMLEHLWPRYVALAQHAQVVPISVVFEGHHAIA